MENNKVNTNIHRTNITDFFVGLGNLGNCHGGGIYLQGVENDDVSIHSTFIQNNTAEGNGGGIYMYNLDNEPIIYNTPTSGNNQLYGTNNDYPSFNRCNIQGKVGMNYNSFDSTPIFYDRMNGNYRLKWNPRSPSIDQGDANQIRTSIDLDNNNRVLFSNIDMGCYEHDGINWLIWMDENMTSMNNEKESNEEVTDNMFTESFSVKIFPNPSNGAFYIALQLPQEQKVTVSLYDVKGKIVSQTDKQLKQGNNQLAFDNDDLSKGLYFCTIITEKGEIFKGKIFIK